MTSILGLLFLTECSRRRAFSATLTGCSRFFEPGVLGLPAFDRGFSVPDGRVTPKHISPGLQRGQLTVASLQLQTKCRVPQGQAPTRDTRSHMSTVDRPPY